MALRDVNILPEWLIHRRLLVRHAMLWACACTLAGLALGGTYGWYTQGVLATRRSPMTVAQVCKQTASTIAEIGRLTKELERLAFVRQAGRDAGKTMILGRLSEVMVPGTWLTDLSLRSDDKAGMQLVITGLSESNAKLGILIRGLTTDAMFRNVTLRSATETRLKQGSEDPSLPEDVIQFTIQAEIQES